MLIQLPEVQALATLSRDGRLLFGTRMVRMFAYGLISVILVLYLVQRHLPESQIGPLLTLTLVGDAVISLSITSIADRVGRRTMLMVGAGLMVLAGVVFATTGNFALLTLAAIIGTISPSGNEVGASLSIEQAALPQTTTDSRRTQVFAWYNFGGSLATALGSLCGGVLASSLQGADITALDSYRVILVIYALLGIVLGFLFSRLSPAIEPHVMKHTTSIDSAVAPFLGLHQSRNVVLKLSGLFMLDAFAGGLVVQSLIAYWFHIKFGVSEATIGAIYFGANILAGFSALAAARVAARFGLINTMVWTHIPSNILLMLVPLMPSLPLAIVVLFARFSISQMDVPTRQSYVMAVVVPTERSAAAGVTSIARTAASALSPLVTGALMSASLLSLPFYLAGGLKIVYDLLLYRSFSTIKPPEESKTT